ncbi:MAG: penicillin-binding protein 2 [Gallionella sp.]|nr:penicillin-binding protein 2 [Gallionella sp.]MDD4959035.1 penicillin-binding protein 2 [Gallionella sp.]
MSATKTPKVIYTRLPGWRASALFGVLLFGLVALFGRAIYLQAFHTDFLKEKGNKRYSRETEVSAHRGKITDRYGTPLAVSTPVKSVWVNPPHVKASAAQISQLARILNMSVSELRRHLFDKKHDYLSLQRHLPPDLADEVERLAISGVLLQREYRRYYPTAEMAAQLIGFTGQDDVGQEGLELSLQEQLVGKSGSRRIIKDRRGHIVEDAGNLSLPKPGKDVALSIDNKVQYVAYRELQNAVNLHHAKAGAVVVLDAQTGEVLALANYPAYNPNNRDHVDAQSMRNRAVTDVFEPGSTMKPFTIAAALDAGKVRPDTLINTQHGVLRIGRKTIHDTHRESSLTVTQVIQKSSNVGAAKIALMMDRRTLWQTFAKSGFGAQTGSAFPGEATGKLRDANTWRPIEQATMSFGHGISVSLLQLARAYTVFANHGELKPISLLKRDADVAGQAVFTSQTAQILRDMLEMVVKPGGTAPLAQVSGYRVAGKTGTAHKLEGGQYVDRYVASFVGFAPASSPRIIVAVMIDEPSNGAYYGGVVAAPVFSKVTEAVLHLLNIPNDAPLNNVIEPPSDVIKEEV